ncbi:MAG: hypothetical protein R3240_06645, partial [Gammaproteobacteria bacterium]|nr:hypothetical protein [Gammaproteobacteria bacterium]
MLNAGSQIFLDNAAPKSTDSLSSSKPSSADDGSFNDIFENANKEIESKNNSNNTNNNSHSSSKDSEKKANESQASHKNTVKSDKTSKPKSSEHTQKTKSDDSAEQAKSSDKAKESAASEKTQAKTSKPDDSDADAAAELEQETQQFIKSNTLNTLSLSQVEKTDETEVDELTDTNVDEKPEKNIHALIARMLNSRNQGKQELDADQKAEAVRQNTLAQLNVPQEKTSEFVKSVVAELRSKSDFNNHIQKQASVAQQDALAKAEVDPMKAALAIDEDMELDDQKVDEFVSQVFERLNMNKSNLEAIIAAKAGNDKIEMQNQIMDQVAQKQSLENVSPLSLASTGVNQKPANN